MKITFVMGFFLPVPPLLGGATEKTSMALAQWLSRRGHEVTLISRTWPGLPDEETREGVKYLRIPGAAQSKHLLANLLHDARWNFTLAKKLPPADVIISHSVFLPFLLPLLTGQSPRVIQWAARMPKGQARLWRKARLILALSHSVADRIIAMEPSLKDRIRIVPFPIDFAGLRAAAKAKTGETTFHIGYAGRIHPEKGIDLLIQAANRLGADPGQPDWKLTLTGPFEVQAGGGGAAYLDSLRAMIGDHARPRITFAGPVNDAAELAKFYASLDVFCYPSLAAQGEALGVAPLEAMAAGAVPLVSHLDCFQDFVRDGENGLIFDAGADDAADVLAGKLRCLLPRPAWLGQTAEKARQTAELYDLAAVGTSLESAVKEAVS